MTKYIIRLFHLLPGGRRLRNAEKLNSIATFRILNFRARSAFFITILDIFERRRLEIQRGSKTSSIFIMVLAFNTLLVEYVRFCALNGLLLAIAVREEELEVRVILAY